LDRALRAAREAASKHALEQSQIEAARDAAVAALEETVVNVEIVNEMAKRGQ